MEETKEVNEVTKKGILGTLEGPIASWKEPTRNGRLYNSELWDKVFSDPLVQEKLQNGGIFGELDHPEDRDDICSDRIAILMTEAPEKRSDGLYWGKFKVLDTPCGRIVKAAADAGYHWGISSRGTGDVDPNTNEVDPDTYQFTCFDVVDTPSVKAARMGSLQLEGYKAPKSEYKNYTQYNKNLTEALKKTTDKEERTIMREVGMKISNNILEHLGEPKEWKTFKEEHPECNAKFDWKVYGKYYDNSGKLVDVEGFDTALKDLLAITRPTNSSVLNDAATETTETKDPEDTAAQELLNEKELDTEEIHCQAVYKFIGDDEKYRYFDESDDTDKNETAAKNWAKKFAKDYKNTLAYVVAEKIILDFYKDGTSDEQHRTIWYWETNKEVAPEDMLVLNDSLDTKLREADEEEEVGTQSIVFDDTVEDKSTTIPVRRLYYLFLGEKVQYIDSPIDRSGDPYTAIDRAEQAAKDYISKILEEAENTGKILVYAETKTEYITPTEISYTDPRTIKALEDLNEGVREDLIAEGIVHNADGTWSNKGAAGKHGKVKTKKAARAQQKAMFANGFMEDLHCALKEMGAGDVDDLEDYDDETSDTKVDVEDTTTTNEEDTNYEEIFNAKLIGFLHSYIDEDKVEISEEDEQQFIDCFYENFPEIIDHIDTIYQDAETSTTDADTEDSDINPEDTSDETLSVGNTEDNEILEELQRVVSERNDFEARLKTAQLAKAASDARAKELETQLRQANQISTSAGKAALEKENAFNSEKESLEGTISSLRDSLQTSRQTADDLKNKLTKTSNTIKQYKDLANDCATRYIDLKAESLGLSSKDIKSRLNESFTLKDVDTICEGLSDYARNLNKLPFSVSNGGFGNNMKATITEDKRRDPLREVKPERYSLADDLTDDLLESWLSNHNK